MPAHMDHHRNQRLSWSVILFMVRRSHQGPELGGMVTTHASSVSMTMPTFAKATVTTNP